MHHPSFQSGDGCWSAGGVLTAARQTVLEWERKPRESGCYSCWGGGCGILGAANGEWKMKWERS